MGHMGYSQSGPTFEKCSSHVGFGWSELAATNAPVQDEPVQAISR